MHICAVVDDRSQLASAEREREGGTGGSAPPGCLGRQRLAPVSAAVAL